MSQTSEKGPSHESSQQPSETPAEANQTMQMNPVILGQAANMSPDSDMFQQLDAASHLLEEAAKGNASLDGGETGDPSIEEYMAALLARSHKPGEVVTPLSVDVMPVVKPSKVVEPAPPVPEKASDEPWKHAAAPECRDSISELRELANISARSSFNVYRGQQLVYEMHNKLSVSLVALVVSFALISFASDAHSPTFFAAIAALIVALYWTVQYFQLGRQLQRLCFANKRKENEKEEGKKKDKSKSKPDEEVRS